ncbi:hypothetical protein ACSFBF_02500 [Variovorax sp. ZT5P49]|uniref:hypothetical protein n=1 Tax=Variovorax sp. ZT5P49 TaxID=3443733 RepID=UPI003F47B403
MQKIRILGACVALGGVALLSGCVGVPGDPYYGGGGYSSGPYYSEPSPVVVAPAPVYIEGGGYYEGRRPYYYDRGRPYYGRPGYPVRPAYPGVRPTAPPAWGGGGRPSAVVPARPGGVPGITPTQPQQMPRGPARLWTSPDSKTQTPP